MFRVYPLHNAICGRRIVWLRKARDLAPLGNSSIAHAERGRSFVSVRQPRIGNFGRARGGEEGRGDGRAAHNHDDSLGLRLEDGPREPLLLPGEGDVGAVIGNKPRAE